MAWHNLTSLFRPLTSMSSGCASWDSGWASWVVFAIQVLVIGQILRAWIGPCILRTISRRVQVRRISLRSVRGVYVRLASMTIRIDRAGISYHPSGMSLHRFSFKVEGLCIEMHEQPAYPHHSEPVLRHHSSLPALADFAISPVARRLWSIYSSIYVQLEPYVRPVIRSFFVTWIRVAIKCVPLLAQVIDFELDRALLTFTTLPEAHVAIRSMTLSSTVVFSNVESVVGGTGEYPRNQLHRRFRSMAHLRRRFTGSVKRVWKHAWGKTQGSASFCLRIQKASGFSSDVKWPQLNSDSVGSSPRHAGASQFAFVTHSSHSNDLCFDLQDSAELFVSFDVGRTRRIVRDHSISASLTLPSIQLFMGPFATLSKAARSARKAPPHPSAVADRAGTRHLTNSAQFADSRRHRHRKVPLLRHIEVNMKDISMRHVIHGKDRTRPQYFTGHIRSISISLEPGESEKNTLHKDFLGSCPERIPDLDAEILTYSFIATEMSVQRRSVAETAPPSRVISITSVNLQGFAAQWDLLKLPTPSIFSGDPNAALLVIKLNILAPQLSERMDIVVDILEHFRKSNPEHSVPREPVRVVRAVPRLKVDIAVDDVVACLTPMNGSSPTSPLILSSTQCVLTISSSFKFFPLSKSSLPELQRPGSVPLEVDFTIQSLLGPAFVMLLPKPFSLDTSSNEATNNNKSVSAIGGDPLLSLSAVELTASGHTLGVLDGHSDGVAIDVASTLMDVKCITDAVSLELWQPLAISSLRAVLNAMVNFSKPSSSAGADSAIGLIKRLPGGINAHFAVGQFGIIITGKDINPDEDTGLSRGIAARTGFALQYCSMYDWRNHVRLPNRFTHAHDRQRLCIPEELLYDAIAISSDSAEDPKKFALFRCTLWDTTFRTSIATEFAADQAYDAKDETEELKSTEFLWISRVELNAAFRYLAASDGDGRMTEQLQLSVKVPSVRSHIQLFNVYCALLALRTVRSLRGPQRSVQSQRPPIVTLTLKVTITTLQLLIRLPLQEHICFRIIGLTVRTPGRGKFAVQLGRFFAWVPSVRERGKWEELARLCSWKIVCDGQRHERLAFGVRGDGARLRIPYGYILADLILDGNIFFKCVKHLIETSPRGAFHPVPSPDAEDAKIVPELHLELGCISLEASDDPLESKLGLIWRAGFEAARSRLDREDAFQDKVTAIRAAEAEKSDSADPESRFSAQHTVTIEEAHERLLLVHSLSWLALHREYRDRQRRNEINIRKETRGEHFNLHGADVETLVPLAAPSTKSPPLLRFISTHLKLDISPPTFPIGDLPEFLHDLGKGLPRSTQFTLLIPLHLHMSMGSTCVTLRDYPLPLLNIVQDSVTKAEAWIIDMDIVVAEEMGTQTSVVWRECSVVPGNAGSKPLNLSIPKTTLPVKTYANPTVKVLTSQLTELCWCNSYAPALQDVMRILDTVTTPPPDPSPPIGFWDKIRLVLHWRVQLNFSNDVHLNLKGSRDPYATEGIDAGFSFCWNGNTRMSIGQANVENELLQVYSDTMLIVIPEFAARSSDEVIGGGISSRFARGPVTLNQGLEGRRNRFRKVVAKFSSGIKWGIGIVLERTCGRTCLTCGGNFSCHLFDFRPHYEIILEPKSEVPAINALNDSFTGFRSDFIHLSTSLTSLVNDKASSVGHGSSSFHLTPKTFAHFWSWWYLFDRYLSLPIRQGTLFPNARPPSKKFGHHLATIKYRIGVQRLFISHLYTDETRDGWSEGVTYCVGVKGLVNSFEADMHQREQEAIVPAVAPNKTQKIRHKPFYAAEVKLTDLQLCAVLAAFVDQSKGLFDLQGSYRESKYKNILDSDTDQILRDFWFDMDDYVETDWQPTEDNPRVYAFPIASCPHFAYFRRTSKQPHRGSAIESSRFGNEDTHICLMGKEQSVQSLQAEVVSRRLSELRMHLWSLRRSKDINKAADGFADIERFQKKIRQLERHLIQLQETKVHGVIPSPEHSEEYASYLMPIDISFPVDWTEFDNVYQAHCPKFSLCNSTRDILVQYYYCSRARRGLEYHMATRAVKYIRDQLNNHLRASSDTDNVKRIKHPTGLAAQVAVQALKKILGNETEDKDTQTPEAAPIGDDEHFNPMAGWSDEAVSQNKSHFCLFLKPQVVLRSKNTKDSVLVLAALQATLQSHAILDVDNIDDPISGRIMTRTHAVLTGLQAFSPSATCSSRYDGVPLEVLLDLRAESSDFDRLVPQTDATFRYDKFNRLRLRNSTTSAVPSSGDQSNSHLQHQTDLIRIHVPRFTVSANSNNFESISNVITTLLLRSDAAHKLHLSKVETLLFRYDFTDLSAAADVVEDLQSRLRRALEHERDLDDILTNDDSQGRLDLMKMKTHIFLLSEELGLIFDAINLAQEKADDKHNDTKMALKVHASAREISWGMVDSSSEMIAKLAVRGIEHSWLNRQDGSTVNNLIIADLQAFDGSLDAEWLEILSKHREPSNHPLVKERRGIFCEADWTVLAPVGGITIFERFILDLHPIRLQLEARVGKSIMEYVWPARRDRMHLEQSPASSEDHDHTTGSNALTQSSEHHRLGAVRRLSMDNPSPFHQRKRYSTEERRPVLGLGSRRITNSRSFNDLRGVARQNSMKSEVSVSPSCPASNRSSIGLPLDETDRRKSGSVPADIPVGGSIEDDAAEMKTRSAQKSFVLVRISSMYILLSFHKDGSFFCRDARIHTRELQYRNQTWSFEELAEQFIPSDTSWRGWMKVALHQPLVPVLPVARELFSKTKLIPGKGKSDRQSKMVVNPKPTLRKSEQPTPSGSQARLPESLKSRKLRRSRRSSQATRAEDEAETGPS